MAVLRSDSLTLGVLFLSFMTPKMASMKGYLYTIVDDFEIKLSRDQVSFSNERLLIFG